MFLESMILSAVFAQLSSKIAEDTIRKKRQSVVDKKLSSVVSEKHPDKAESLGSRTVGELFQSLTLDELVAYLHREIDKGMQQAVRQVNKSLDAVYTEQLAKAQDFVNGSSDINIHALRELLRELLPESYSPAIKKIKPGQSVKTIINILGGQNQILPNAEKGEQHTD